LDPFNEKIEDLKKLLSSNPEFKYYSNLRKATQILLFGSIAKIAKEKLSSETSKLSISIEAKDITTNSIDFGNNFEKELKFIHEISEKIAATLDDSYKDAKEKYIKKAKSIISNLRLNSDLYQALLEERITPEEIAKMDEKVIKNLKFL
jgi:hypothetical protein